MIRQKRMEMFREETAARREAEALCERLHARGDDDSVLAAAMILGTIDAYASLVGERQSHREKMDEMRSNLRSSHDLIARVPHDVLTKVVHGKRS